MQKLYVIQVGESGPCKIGIARDAGKRIADLQVANPARLYLRLLCEPIHFAARDLESKLHHYFSQNRKVGEWFDVSPRRVSVAIREKIIRPLPKKYPTPATIRKLHSGNMTSADVSECLGLPKCFWRKGWLESRRFPKPFWEERLGYHPRQLWKRADVEEWAAAANAVYNAAPRVRFLDVSAINAAGDERQKTRDKRRAEDAAMWRRIAENVREKTERVA